MPFKSLTIETAKRLYISPNLVGLILLKLGEKL